jgi:hypothetical protein
VCASDFKFYAITGTVSGSIGPTNCGGIMGLSYEENNFSIVYVLFK